MKRAPASFAAALLFSLALHAALILPWPVFSLTAAKPAPARIALDAVLVAPHAPALFLPEDVAPAQAAKPPPAPGRKAAGRAAAPAPDAFVRQAAAEVARALLYPPEAIARGLEGEAQVLLFLDETGSVVAARLERSSGHALLDEAALRAARSVRSLPGGGAREVLLPVRFRLE